MSDGVYARILDSLDRHVFCEKKRFDPGLFRGIPLLGSDSRVLFVDGGQAEIFRSVSFSLQFFRVVGVVFKNNQRLDFVKNEFFCLITSKKHDDKILFNTEFFPLHGLTIDSLSFDSFDPELRTGFERFDISRVGDFVRRLAELRLAADYVGRLQRDDVVVFDGCLRPVFQLEMDFLDSLFLKADAAGVFVCSLVKSSRLFVDGRSLLSCLADVDVSAPWFFRFDDRFVVRLNKYSKHLFEFNIHAGDPVLPLSLLVKNSSDPVFFGYPYGLILADRFARVSNLEKQQLFTKFQLKAGEDWSKIRDSLNILSSHEILDNIS